MSIIAGTVVSVHPENMSYDVVMNNGGVLYNIGMLNSTGGPFSTDVNPTPNLKGAAVALIKLYNKWYILGTVPVPVAPSVTVSTSATNTGTATDNEDTYGSTTVQSKLDYSGGRTTSVLPGDKYMAADGGSELLLGAEGLAMLKASPLAQLILGGFRDFATLVAREFTINTDFGVVNFSNGGNGTTGMSILGGSNFCDESGTNDPIYTFKMYAGTVPGDPLARYAMYVYNADRSEYVYIVIDKDGNINIETSEDEEKTIGRDQITEITENRTTTIHIDDTLTVDSNRTTSIGADETRSVGGDESTSISGSRTLTVGSQEDHTTTGTLNLTTGNLVIKTGGLTLSSLGTGSAGNCTVTCSSLDIVKG